MVLELLAALVPVALAGIASLLAYGKLQTRVEHLSKEVIATIEYAQTISAASHTQGVELARLDERIKGASNDLRAHQEADIRAFGEIRDTLTEMSQKMDRLVANIIEKRD